MVAKEANYTGLPGNESVLVVVDAWQAHPSGSTWQIRVRLNRQCSNSVDLIQFWFGTPHLRPRIVQGSVKMGQAIEHPVFAALPVTVSSTAIVGVKTRLYQYNLPAQPPGAWFIVVSRRSASVSPRNIAISPWMKWSDLPLRVPSSGGY